MPYQVLTGQWSKIYTHKFRVKYSDFTYPFANYAECTLLDLPRTVEVIGVKMWLREAFVRTGMTLCTGYVVTDQVASYGLESQFDFAFMQLNATPGDDVGTLVMTAGRVNTAPNPDQYLICNQTAPTQIDVRVKLTYNSGSPPFTAGEFDIWIMTMKLP